MKKEKALSRQNTPSGGLSALNKPRENPPEDGCAEVRDYYGETSCGYEPPFCCDECMYADHNRKGKHPRSNRGKNPQAKRWFPEDDDEPS